MLSLKGQHHVERMLVLNKDVARLLEKIRSVPDLALIVIDPITNYLGEEIKMNHEEEVRRVLMPLVIAAKERQITFITIGHLNRRESGTESLQRIMGAAAFHGVARFIYMVGPDPDSEDKHCHVLVQRRGVDAPALRYQTKSTPVEWAGKTSDVISVQWNGVSSASAEDTVDPHSLAEKGITARAAKALREILRDGRKPKEVAMKALGEAGFDVDSLNVTRLLQAAKADSKRFEGEKHYSWFLPSS
jgi:hypothetical protein